jgi:hypothetical protein
MFVVFKKNIKSFIKKLRERMGFEPEFEKINTDDVEEEAYYDNDYIKLSDI